MTCSAVGPACSRVRSVLLTPAVAAAVVVSLLCMVATWQVGASLHRREVEEVEDAFRAEATQSMAASLGGIRGAVRSFASFAHVFAERSNRTQPMSLDGFNDLARLYTGHGRSRHVMRIMVTVLVEPAERAAWEAEFGRPIGSSPSMAFTAPTLVGGSYVPIVHAYPEEDRMRYVGVGAASVGAIDSEALVQSLASGQVVATPITEWADGTAGISFHAPVGTGMPYTGCLISFTPLGYISEQLASYDPERVAVSMTDITGGASTVVYEEPRIDSSTVVELAVETMLIAGRLWRFELSTSEDVINETANRARVGMLYVLGFIASVAAGVLVYMLLAAAVRRHEQRLKNLSTSVAANTHARMLNFINHELRNPMTVVMAIVEQYLSPATPSSKPFDEEALHADMAAAMRATKDMDRVLGTVCDVSDVQGGHLTLKPVSTDVLGLLRDTANHVSSFCPTGVSLTTHSDLSVPRHVVLDSHRLRQVLTAALRNALKASQAEGTVEVHVHALTGGGQVVGAHEEDSTAYVVVEVLNAGKEVGRSPSRLLEDSSVEAAMPAVTAPAAVLAAARVPLTAINVCTCTVAPEGTPPSPRRVAPRGQSPSQLMHRFRQRQRSSSRSSHEHAVLADRAMEEVAITLTLPLCRRVAVAMGGDIGISDIRVAPSRTITRFWCVVAATPTQSSTRHLNRALHQTLSLGGVAAEVPLTARSRRDVLEEPGVVGGRPAAVSGVGGAGSVGGVDSASTATVLAVHHGAVDTGPQSLMVRGAPSSGSSVSFSCAVDMGGGIGVDDYGSTPPRSVASGRHVSPPSVASLGSRPKLRAINHAALGGVALPPGLTAMVVDDERMIRRVVERYLDKMGVEVVASLDDGDLLADALAHVPSPPSIVLLDIVMKRSNGLSVLQQLRQKHPECASIPVYAMTSNIELVAEYEAAGFAGLVGKPFNRRKLAAAVQHCATGFADASRLTQSGFFVA